MERLHRLVRYPELWLLSFAALVTRLWQLDLPRAVVFDEVYFRQFAANYLDGHYFFDIHPPLVKLLFAGIGNMAGLTPDQVASGDPGIVILRLVPAIAGALLVPLMYIIIRQLGLGRPIAFLGALLVLCDNALLVESRFVLMDSTLLLLGMASISSYLALRKSKGFARWAWVVATAVFMGFLVSTKWSGLAVAGLIALAWLIESILHKADWRRMIGEATAVLAIIAAMYIGSFAAHFALLTHSGEGDAFMSEKFQSTLIGNARYDESSHMSLWDKIVELNQEMYTAQSTLNDVVHPYASRWYSWPLQIRPVYYWQGPVGDDGQQGHIYLLGNPVVWLLTTVSVIITVVLWIAKPRWFGHKHPLVGFLLLGYGVSIVPFAFLERPFFLYHYLFALLFAVLITCFLLSRIFEWQVARYGRKAMGYIFGAIVIAVIFGFVYFLPLSYGWPLSPTDLQQRMWFPTWR